MLPKFPKLIPRMLLILISICLFSNSAFSQSTLKGKITDMTTGNGVSGASVVIVGLNGKGAVSDYNGNFEIGSTSKDKEIEISAIGYQSQKIKIGNKTFFEVRLASSSKSLDEVVVIGYGAIKKRDFTGAVTQIKAKDLPMTANPNVATMLQGKAPGLIITQTSAEPGGGLNLFIRGQANGGAGNTPLYVIDGVPVSADVADAPSPGQYGGGFRSPLNSINPNDIESIEILKDASATAIYGARASNGVVMITTKRGKEGKVLVTYSGYSSIQKIGNRLEPLSKNETREWYRRADHEKYLISNNLPPYGKNDPNTAPPFVSNLDLFYKDSSIFTNWPDLILRTGTINEHNISISSGTATSRLYVSLGYFDQSGIIKKNEFKRYTGRVNYDAQFLKKFKFSLSAAYSLNDIANVSQLRRDANGAIQGDQGNEQTPLLPLVQGFSPFIAIQNPDGTYPLDPLSPTVPNPASLLDVTDNSRLQRLFGKMGLHYELISGLTLGLDYGFDLQGSERKTYVPTSVLFGTRVNGQATQSEATETNKLVSYTINYQKSFNKKHNINALIGHDYQEFGNDNFNATATGFITNSYLFNNMSAGANPPGVGSSASGRIFSSYFGRLIYKFDDKYLITATLRRDGSSNFAENYKHGTFPSLALAWQLDEEPFIKNIESISALKLRASYGVTGNGNIGNNAFSIYSSNINGPYNVFIGRFLFGDRYYTGVAQVQLSNPNLRWEASKQVNVGVDYGFLKNRINGSFDIFKKTIDGLLGFRSLNFLSNVAGYTANTGIRTTTGWEFLVTGRIIERQDLRLTASANVARYIDRWKDRQTSDVLDPWIPKNERLGNIYGYISDGIYRVGDKIPAAMPEIKPGNLIFRDINGYDSKGNLTGKPDGMISSADASILGNTSPDFSVGFTTNLFYKKFDLTLNTYGLLGMDMYKTKGYNIFPGGFITKEAKKVYYSDNPTGIYPGLAPNLYYPSRGDFGSDFNLQRNVSFLRLKNVTLGYSFSNQFMQRLGLISARFFIDAQNLAVITNYDGLDPETGFPGEYPIQKTYSFGLNLNF